MQKLVLVRSSSFSWLNPATEVEVPKLLLFSNLFAVIESCQETFSGYRTKVGKRQLEDEWRTDVWRDH